jgi:hypothetical protein
MNRCRPAQPVDLPLLERPQQLRLQVGVHLADLVEQQRSAVGRLEFSHAARDRAGERPLLVAEQFGFQQIVRNRRAVQCNEGAA